jgi:ABC-2 type transport system permease protein
MNATATLATARRVLGQLRRDHRTLALLLVVPLVLTGLLAWIYDGTPMFDRIGAPLLGVFPFVVMFLVTSVATLRERTSGTLERLLTLPIGKVDLLVGCALAFGLVAVAQSVLTVGFALYVLGLDVAGPAWLLVVVALLDAWLGMALGLAVSAFASTEFQAVQFLPALVLPQFLLCGLLADRDTMPDVLSSLSDVLPLTYAVQAMQRIAAEPHVSAATAADLAVVAVFTVAVLLLGAATLRRRTP